MYINNIKLVQFIRINKTIYFHDRGIKTIYEAAGALMPIQGH